MSHFIGLLNEMRSDQSLIKHFNHRNIFLEIRDHDGKLQSVLCFNLEIIRALSLKLDKSVLHHHQRNIAIKYFCNHLCSHSINKPYTGW